LEEEEKNGPKVEESKGVEII